MNFQILKNGEVAIEGAKILFRNLAGNPTKFTPAGKRTFSVILEPQWAEAMAHEGWNIKTLRPRDDEDQPTPYIQVECKFGQIPPKVIIVTSAGMRELNEDTVASIDYAEIANVDIVLRPYDWEVNGNSGRKAYVKAMYVTVVEDVFASKYADEEF